MSKKTLNIENLTNLGEEKLARLLLEFSAGNADIKRCLRLELAQALGAKELAGEIRKRFATIKRSQRFIDWRAQGAFVRDLEMQLDMIANKIAPDNPVLAFDLLWQFMGLADSVYERVDDSNGEIGSVFYDAVTLFEDVGPRSGIEVSVLAEKIFEALLGNDYGQYDDLIPHLGSTLGEIGLNRLKSIIETYEREPIPEDPDPVDRNAFLSVGMKGYAPDRSFVEQQKTWFVRSCLQQIADELGDVDGYIAQYTPENLLNPTFASRVATRLLVADRASEALDILISSRAEKKRGYPNREWDTAYIKTLENLGREEELRAFRWQCFEKELDTTHLRDLLKSLPDFDDFEVEERAKEWAMRYPSVSSALEFFLEWPDLRLAADLIMTRSAEFNGDMYYALSPAADRLQGDFPLAAVLARRVMIRDTLEKGKSTRYKYGVRHLLECQSADNEIEDYGNFVTHKEFEEQLRAAHSRKASFWSKMG